MRRNPLPLPEGSERPPTKVSSVVKADIHALLVAADLLKQGLVVFRKLGRACPCDLVIVRRRRCWRVAVGTVHYFVRLYFRGRPEPWWPPDPERFDMLAYVSPDGFIRYEPPLERLHKPACGTLVTRSSRRHNCKRMA
jgi:hypothetical protein